MLCFPCGSFFCPRQNGLSVTVAVAIFLLMSGLRQTQVHHGLLYVYSTYAQLSWRVDSYQTLSHREARHNSDLWNLLDRQLPQSMDMAPPVFIAIHVHRTGTTTWNHRGRLSLVYRNCLHVKRHPLNSSFTQSSVEDLVLIVNSGFVMHDCLYYLIIVIIIIIIIVIIIIMYYTLVQNKLYQVRSTE